MEIDNCISCGAGPLPLMEDRDWTYTQMCYGCSARVKHCERCREFFVPDDSRVRICMTCKTAPADDLEQRECDICETVFTCTTNSRRKLCGSPTCRRAYNRYRMRDYRNREREKESL